MPHLEFFSQEGGIFGRSMLDLLRVIPNFKVPQIVGLWVPQTFQVIGFGACEPGDLGTWSLWVLCSLQRLEEYTINPWSRKERPQLANNRSLKPSMPLGLWISGALSGIGEWVIGTVLGTAWLYCTSLLFSHQVDGLRFKFSLQVRWALTLKPRKTVAANIGRTSF